ncbi:MAG: ATP-grasp domain-containing protein, partial [Clostridia bacterium]|nr:ATP-grasp domain-containing protein [Clostridia bacterium]
GSMAGLFGLCKIPTTCSKVAPSSMSMDKDFTKILLKGLNVKHLPAVKINSIYDLHKKEEDLKEFPLIVKPNSLGSSIGITKAENRSQLINGILLALKYDDSVIIEPCLENFIEINCAVYRDYNGKVVVSECERPIFNNEILDFNDKYKNGEREFPARIDKRITDKIKKTTKKVYESCNFSGIIRIDYMVKDNAVYLNEINSVPGSLAYYLFSDTLKEFSEILTDIIEKSIKDNEKSKTTVKTFNSGILDGVGTKGAKHL